MQLRSALASDITAASTLSAVQRETACAAALSLRTAARRDPIEQPPADAMGDQFRSFVFPIEARDDQGDGRTLLGRAVPYGVETRVGTFSERFELGAFAKQIASGNVEA